jgi:hypothetical protein
MNLHGNQVAEDVVTILWCLEEMRSSKQFADEG